MIKKYILSCIISIVTITLCSSQFNCDNVGWSCGDDQVRFFEAFPDQANDQNACNCVAAPDNNNGENPTFDCSGVGWSCGEGQDRLFIVSPELANEQNACNCTSTSSNTSPPPVSSFDCSDVGWSCGEGQVRLFELRPDEANEQNACICVTAGVIPEECVGCTPQNPEPDCSNVNSANVKALKSTNNGPCWGKFPGDVCGTLGELIYNENCECVSHDAIQNANIDGANININHNVSTSTIESSNFISVEQQNQSSFTLQNNVNLNIEASGCEFNPPTSQISNSASNQQTKALYECLKAAFDQHIYSGVHNANDGFQDIVENTGKAAAIIDEDVWSWHPWNSESYQIVLRNKLRDIRNHHSEGGIVTLTWHWPDLRIDRNINSLPVTGTNPNTGQPITSSLFAWINHRMPFDNLRENPLSQAEWDQILDQPNSHLGRVFRDDIDRAIDEIFIPLKNDGIPILFRPLHEIDGGWFWWTNASCPDKTTRLWRLVYDTFKDRGLNNIIWVWSTSVGMQNGTRNNPPFQLVNGDCAQTGCGGSGTADRSPAAFYPGDDVVDVVGWSGYHVNYKVNGSAIMFMNNPNGCGTIEREINYRQAYQILDAVAPTKPKALSETDKLPNAQLIADGDARFDLPWVYALAWYTPKSTVKCWLGGSRDGTHDVPCGGDVQYHHDMFNHSVYITRDEMSSACGALNNSFASSESRSQIQQKEEFNQIAIEAKIFPNPTSDVLNIDFKNVPADMIVNVQIFDQAGKLVLGISSDQNSNQFDVSSLSSGIYSILLQSPIHGYRHSEKLVITK